MFRKYILPMIAVAGLLFAIFSVVKGQRPVPSAPPVAQPANAPYESYIAGAGIIETSSENIAIGAAVPGLVIQVPVQVGDKVKTGDPLFKLDDRNLQAELIVKQAALQSSREKLLRLQQLPRVEDIPPLEAKVQETQSNLADLENQLKMWESITDRRAITADDLERKRFAVKTQDARLQAAKSELAQLKAGAWKPDLEIAKADVASAEAQVKSTQIDMERMIVRAPVDGHLLQVKIHAGEYAPSGVLAQPLMLLGAADRLHVRVDIDENDAWRLRTDSKAVAYVRGNRDLKTDLTFVRIEPYVIPKKSLTGDSTERVDTRVLQVLYSFPAGVLPVYVGQQMDVFIAAPPVSGGTIATTQISNQMEKKE